MNIALIVAMTKDRVIGLNNQMPWHLPADLKRFREITMGKPILMGRKTHESIGRVLPGRENIILTRDPDYSVDDCTIVHDIEEAMNRARNQEIMVIGGSAVYEAFLPIANRLYLTLVEGDFKGDTYFPDFDRSDWTVFESTPVFEDAISKTRYSYVTLDRKDSSQRA